MGGSSKKQTIGYKYFLGVQMAICHGPVDSISAIDVDERTAWTGLNDGTERITINSPGLFGGKKGEGGISGEVDIEMGLPTQVENDYLQSQLGDNIPGFRGVVCAILRHVYMGNNPYLKPWSFQASRIHLRQNGIAQWYDEKAAIINTLVTAENEAIECNDFACDALLVALINTPGIFNVGYFSTTDGQNYGDDETGQGHNWTLDAGGTAAITYDTEEGSPANCDRNYAHVWQGTANPSRIVPSPDVDYPGTIISAGAVVRQHATTGSDDLPIIAISRQRGATDGVRVMWERSTGDLTLYSYDSRLGGALITPMPFAAPPENTWFFVQIAVNLSSKTCKANIAYLDGAGEQVIETHNSFIRYNEDTTWQFGAVVDITNVASGDNLAKYDYIMGWIIEGVTPPTSDLIAEFFNSDIDYVRPELCYVCSDMNPAHIIRECLTDPTWGMGYQDADINDTAFMASADQLHTEDMGMSLLWDRELPLEDFVLEIITHIDAVLFVDRTTGKFVLNLIREEAVDGSTLVLDETNLSSVSNASRPAIGELISSVTVQFHDGLAGEDGSLTVHNAALQQVQGIQSNVTRQYQGFTNRVLAARVALRDLKAISTPLLSAQITANREAQALNIGDMFVLDWPDLVINSLPMRVTSIDYGDGVNNEIIVNCLEDSFSLPDIVQSNLDEPVGWTNPNSVLPVAASPRLVTEAPYYELVRDTGQLNIDTILADEALAGFLLVAGGRVGVELNSDLLVDSGAGYVDSGTMDFSPHASLIDNITHTTTRFYINGQKDTEVVVLGSMAQINDELLRVDATGTDGRGLYFDFGRGVLDTVPAVHSATDTIIFWDASSISDETQYTSTDSVNVKLTTSAVSGQLSEALAPVDNVVMASRAIRPYSAADFQIGSESYKVDQDLAGTMPVLDWAHRDRLQQTGGTLLDYTDASIGPEASTTYIVSADAISVDGSITTDIFTLDVGSGDTYDTSAQSNPAADTAYLDFKVQATRGGYTSWQTAQHRVIWDEDILYSDPDISSVELLMHFEGADASTTFKDSGGNSLTVAAGGNAQIDTDQFKFGSSSVLFDGINDYLTQGATGDWNFMHDGTEDWTFDIWVRPQENGVTRTILDTGGEQVADNGILIYLTANGIIALRVTGSGGVYCVSLISPIGAVPDDEWSFVRATCVTSTGLWSLAVNRVTVDSDTDSGNSLANHTGVLTFGRESTGTALDYKGHMAEARITRGVARYLGELPTAAFPDNGAVIRPKLATLTVTGYAPTVVAI